MQIQSYTFDLHKNIIKYVCKSKVVLLICIKMEGVMFDRTIYPKIKDCLEHYPVVVVTGARQVGKSTEVYKLVKDCGFHYVSLDNLMERSLAQTDPMFFIQQHELPLIIDEVQYAPILLEVIESIVNKKRLEQGSANGLFVLTGSQAFSMMEGVTQSLAGRACILNMMPLSANEIDGKEEKVFVPSMTCFKKEVHPVSVKELFKRIVRGFYPELHRDPESDTSLYYRNYVNTYIDRDVSELINIKDKLVFHNFLQHIATLTSQQVNYASISKMVGVSATTIKSWLSILEASGILYFLQPYSEIKLSKRIVKAQKMYFSDTGLAAYLARIYSSENLEISNLAGAFMETYVMNEIKKSYINNGREFSAYYYRDSNQNEVDLILLEDGRMHCIEIKKGSLFSLKDVKGFTQLEKTSYEKGLSCILCNTDKNYALSKDVFVYSIDVI